MWVCYFCSSGTARGAPLNATIFPAPSPHRLGVLPPPESPAKRLLVPALKWSKIQAIGSRQRGADSSAQSNFELMGYATRTLVALKSTAAPTGSFFAQLIICKSVDLCHDMILHRKATCGRARGKVLTNCALSALCGYVGRSVRLLGPFTRHTNKKLMQYARLPDGTSKGGSAILALRHYGRFGFKRGRRSNMFRSGKWCFR